MLGQQPEGFVDTSLEVLGMNEWFEESVKCEAWHLATKCTHDVTHLLSSKCQPDSILICSGAAGWKMEQREIVTCMCKRPASECWKIIPV